MNKNLKEKKYVFGTCQLAMFGIRYIFNTFSHLEMMFLQFTGKPVAIINSNTISATQNFKPVLNDVPKPNETTLIATSPPLLSPVGSPTESLNLSQDLQTSFKKGQVGVSANEKHSRVHTMSGSGSEVIKKSLKDLQRSSVSIARYQSMLDEVRTFLEYLCS